MEQKPPGNILFRVLRILGKALLILLVLLFCLVVLIHVPFVQKKVTGKVADYLSTKLETRVDIQSIRFSIFGDLTIKGIGLWNPGQEELINVQEIRVSSSIPGLISGEYVFDEIYIEGLKGHLKETDEGMNIQFILDAFGSDEQQDTSSNIIEIQFKKIILKDITFAYRSLVSRMSLDIELDTFFADEIEYTNLLNTVKANSIFLEGSSIQILSDAQTESAIPTDTLAVEAFFTPDFGTGVALDVKDLKIHRSSFAYHIETVYDTPKFDPSHISLKDIQIDVSDVMMYPDTLMASLDSLYALMPGFTLSHAQGDIRMNKSHVDLSAFTLRSGINDIVADISARYDQDTMQIVSEPNFRIEANAHLQPNDFAYFLDDEYMGYIKEWKATDIRLTGDYARGSGELTQLEVRSGNSFLSASGKIRDVMRVDDISWQDMQVQAEIGSAFHQVLTSFADQINIPPDISIQLVTSGNMNEITLDGDVRSAWGDVTAKGMVAPFDGGINMDINMTGQRVQPARWMDVPWLGEVSFSTDAKGMVGDRQDVSLDGVISSIQLMDQTIQDIAFQTQLGKETVVADINIRDKDYPARIHTDVSFAGPIVTATAIQLTEFKAGQLLKLDSSLIISGNFVTELTLDQDSIAGFMHGDSIDIRKQNLQYEMDTMALTARITASGSAVDYFSERGSANVTANFDLRDLPGTIQPWIKRMLNSRTITALPAGNKEMTFNLRLDNAAPLLLFGMEVDDFTSLEVQGTLDQQIQKMEMVAHSGRFGGYGVSLDTFNASILARGDSMTASMAANNLMYASYQLGQLNFDMETTGDSAVSNLNLSRDTITLLNLRTHLIADDSSMRLYPDELIIYDEKYTLDRNNQLTFQQGNVLFDNFRLSQRDMQLSIAGDIQNFEADFKNVDLKMFNPLLSTETEVINQGLLNGQISYTREEALDVQAQIDSLVLYESIPFAVTMAASTKDRQVPFQFVISNATNRVDMDGIYFLNNEEINADVIIDVQNLEMFSFLATDVFYEMNGSMKGDVKVLGPLKRPEVKGTLRLLDAGFVTANPKFSFHVPDDIITLETSGITFDKFVVYDDLQHPLTISGFVRTTDYASFNYDLLIKSDAYTLLNNPGATGEQLSGLLILGTDISLLGNDKETSVKANITIKDDTDLTFLLAQDEIDLLDAEGIVVFVDPAMGSDSSSVQKPASYYDSLITSLPDFNLNVLIQIEDNARLQVITNAQSGDYIEVAGGGRLELTSDRTGNPSLVGKYILTDGVYRISFYDLVKKNFVIVPGSSINWSGNPQLGDLDINAEYVVQTNSIGLIGHEVGESEKANYKRALDYKIGITIRGTIENPIVSFTLDLSEADKASYPALANKLYRLKQPEFQAELNKQVFGLLALGGFLPESSGSDINSNQIATTALYNSVNSILAGQLNRLAGQYIKGVNIDVGFQSYSDFSTPGGKTQTAMDFRVSKSILDDRLSFEVGGDFDINNDQSGANMGDNYRGDIAIIYDLTGNGDKLLKLFNNETYDIVYQEIRNTGISLVFIREFDKGSRKKKKDK